uniref:Regulatory protein RecX n=2 Tax=Oryza TaxID=4527 RepID=G9C2W5_ORYPU|nr:putative regulatory protein RecX family protein [Oryza punctata]AEV41005.1 putative regulatory protein RecX family protein [Oryza minuta]
MAAATMAASRRLLQLRPELGLRLRSRALIPYPSWRKGMGPCRYEPSQRRLSSCRRAAKNKRPWGSSSDEQLTHGDDGDGTAKYMGKNFPDEFAQLSLEEEESDDEVRGISKTMVKDVEKAAVELLAGRAFTVSDLRKKLRAKKFPDNAVDSVIADFKSRGLLNDGYYAESFSRSRWLSSTWGPKRIKQALRQKGVQDAEADQATRRVFQDAQSNQTMYGISEDSMDHLFEQAAKQWQRGQSLPLENRRARVVRWLQYRGFNWAVTNAIVRKLEAQQPP